MVHDGVWIIFSHDVRLVVLAILISTVAALTAFSLLERVDAGGNFRLVWRGISATVAGVGVWATHFIAMLAHQHTPNFGYDPGLTALSAVLSSLGFGAAWSTIRIRRRWATVATAALITSGVAAMHYTGMAAINGWADFKWSPLIVALSIGGCLLFAGLAIAVYRRRFDPIPWRPAAFLVLAIATLHFGGMSGVAITPVSAVEASGDYLSADALVALILSGSSMLTLAALFLALHDRIAERERATRAISHLVYHDNLTGLHNRAMLDRDLELLLAKADAEAGSVGLLCVDLDGFKAVNDLLGHSGGDMLLRKVADRLRAATDAGELIARTGGDEFVIVQPRQAQPEAAQTLAARVVSTLKAPFEIDGQTIRIGASVGVALFPLDAETADDLVKKADVALYQAKYRGRGGVSAFSRELELDIMRKKDFERALADAMDRNEFRLLYQPIISVSSGRITAFETLLRWDRPGHGTIVPDEFIPIAEERGLINDIGMWVLKEACSHAASWPAPISICVNFSPVQFMDAKLPGEVRRVLRAVKLDPRRLEVEVTENVLLEDPNRALAIFEKLRSLGVRISLDDFGTGFSSLSYFRQFPFDSVKIDKSFTKTICEPISLEIIRAVVDLGGKLDIRVIAEGVETSAQFDALRSLRCGSVQGYLLGKPMQYRDATAMIVRQASLERAA